MPVMWLDKRLDVLRQLVIVEADFPHDGVHVATGVVAEFDFTRLVFLDHLGDVGVTVPARGEGIKPRGPSTRPSRPTTPIMSGAAIQASKSNQPSWICLASSSCPTSSAPASRRGLGQLALGEHDDSLSLSDSMRQDDRTTNDLVGLLGVDTQPHVHFDRLVELGVAESFQHLNGLGQGQRIGLSELASPRRCNALISSALNYPSMTSSPMLRAVPSIIRRACSRSLAFRSASLLLANVVNLGTRDLTHLVAIGYS